MTLKLLLHGEEVFRWDVRPGPARHKNTACPRGYPATVREPEHEHHWIAGCDMRCAKPLKGLAECDHRQTLEKFCVKARLHFEPTYRGPVSGEQFPLRLP